ncbi:hypothetical protein [Methylacidimicrobium tartarophylax]|uniref:Uncharacterized protein n=1 Tax=Methylacidimicrobium tartarophylax TaxID=1041768 RepID=A0A5E6MC31_9BACT|nr:hypothetical protein [Methylacidimicrobium tartarophylax]VVM06470.1 hypothetical protein MAMT_01211 [Methylacidimicrobium tartarophylax]
MTCTGGGVSPEARLIEERLAESRSNLQDSVSLGRRDVEERLYTIAVECRKPNWDGSGAEPISDATHSLAHSFLAALPLGSSMPTVGAEPDGQITFEWHRSAHRTLSVSIDPERRVHYSALLGASRMHGEEPFFGEIPEPIVNIIGRLDRF